MAPAAKDNGKPKVTKRFSQDSKEFKKLVVLFKEGKIKNTDQPAAVRAKFPQHFGDFTPSQFRSQLTKAKNLAGANLQPAAAATGDDDDDDDDEEEADDEMEELMESIGGNQSVVAGNGINKPKKATTTIPGMDTFSSNPIWCPKRLLAEWTNQDGVRCAAILVNLSSGCLDNYAKNVEVGLADNGNIVQIAENYSEEMLDTDAFYQHQFQRDSKESDADFNRRKNAMHDAALRKKQHTTSIYNIKAPFREEPSELRYEYSGDADGEGRYVHIDICERRKAEQKVLHLVRKKSTRSDKSPPAGNEYAKLNIG